jgi:hypothetical protein
VKRLSVLGSSRFVERPSPSQGPGSFTPPSQFQQGLFSVFPQRPQRAIAPGGGNPEGSAEDPHQFPRAEFGGFVPVSDHSLHKHQPKVDDHVVPRLPHESDHHSKRNSRHHQQPITNFINKLVRQTTKNAFS